MTVPVVTIRLDTRQLDKIAAGLNKNTDYVLGQIAKNIEGYAKMNVPPHVVTGALMNSIKADKRGLLDWWVHDEVEYGIHIEFPGITRRWPGAPFMVPAAEQAGNELNSGALWRRLFE